LDTDMCIVELVDDDHRPVPRGIPSTKVIVTNLYNVTQPLIRYELTDTFVRRPDAAGLREPAVTLRIVDSLQRHSDTGKVRRVVPVDTIGERGGRS
jgi:phenylacetate-coenzyme A ligase PaaK-like adenylate-forming protein